MPKVDPAQIAADLLKAGRKTIPASIVEPLVLEIWRSRKQIFSVCQGLSRVISDAGNESLNITLADLPKGRR